MLLTTFKEFSINDKVRIKKEVIYDFLMGNLLYQNSENDQVIEHVIHTRNLLTIAQIENNPYLLLQTYFHFNECNGALLYNQIEKHLPIIYVVNFNDC